MRFIEDEEAIRITERHRDEILASIRSQCCDPAGMRVTDIDASAITYVIAMANAWLEKNGKEESQLPKIVILDKPYECKHFCHVCGEIVPSCEHPNKKETVAEGTWKLGKWCNHKQFPVDCPLRTLDRRAR